MLCAVDFREARYLIEIAVSGPCEKETAETNTPSLDGSCGPNFPKNRTCTGSAVGKFGACCSNYGYCGNSTDFCKQKSPASRQKYQD